MEKPPPENEAAVSGMPPVLPTAVTLHAVSASCQTQTRCPTHEHSLRAARRERRLKRLSGGARCRIPCNSLVPGREYDCRAPRAQLHVVVAEHPDTTTPLSTFRRVSTMTRSRLQVIRAIGVLNETSACRKNRWNLILFKQKLRHGDEVADLRAVRREKGGRDIRRQACGVLNIKAL